jgi:hypothetical protein
MYTVPKMSAVSVVVFCGIFVAGVSGQTPPVHAATPAAHPQAPVIHPRDFNSPEEAASALIAAASKNDAQDLTSILGTSGRGLMTSGNADQDREERQEFSQLAMRRNRIEHSTMDSTDAVLVVGDEDWPFPVPLVRAGQKWHFDPELGSVEIRARRIGADELDAIEICMGYVGAQEAYAMRNRAIGMAAYAQKIMSSPGGRDGLYQGGSSAGQELVPEGFAKADAALPGADRKPYHGYYFRVLKEQGPGAPGGNHKYLAGGAMIGGFALIAWPADYGVSGIHTFMVNQDGIVVEKDLGARTATVTPAITRYDPDETWTPVD